MLLCLLSFILSVLNGYLLLNLLLPKVPFRRSYFFLKIVMGLGIYLAIQSAGLFAFIYINRVMSQSFIFFDLFFTAVFVVLTFLDKREQVQGFYPEEVSSDKYDKIFSICAYFLILTGIVLVAAKTIGNIYGIWDAWASWNVTAKHLESGNLLDFLKIGRKIVNNPPYANDHPLFNPLLSALYWHYLGRQIPLIPILQSVLMYILTVFSTMLGVRVLAGKNNSLLTGLVFCTFPIFITTIGSAQYVDVTLAFYMLSFCIVCLLTDLGKSSYRIYLLLGLAAGMNTWIKNEGFFFTLTAAACFLFVFLIMKMDLKGKMKRAGLFLLGIAPFILIYVVFKSLLMNSEHMLLTQQSEGIKSLILKLFDIKRYLFVMKEYIYFILEFEQEPNGLFAMFASLAILLLLKRDNRKQPSFSVSPLTYSCVFLVLALMFVLHFFVYIISPYNLKWHISTSIGRILIHFIPSSIIIFFAKMKWKDIKQTFFELRSPK